MKIVSWNVNSLNVRLPHVLDYLKTHAPDVLALQETKTPDEKFPQAEIEAAAYHVVFSGQKTYNGVALLSKTEAVDVQAGIPEFEDAQRRVLAATINGVRIIDVYIPNGQEVGSEKYEYKLGWLKAFSGYLKAELVTHEKLLVLGDFNIAPADIDIHDPSRWQGKIMCSDTERQYFFAMLAMGLADSLRSLHPSEGMHSWWDYRLNAFQRNWGIRIDHILTTAALIPLAGGVHREERGRERPSDHAPVWVELQT
ncbi:MAG: exodeoxyribonuclease III [Zetaproteobacteria bacterium CG12_big_fil_rev_8_21_14_0_65_55_1124]|nr:MAG: exodeoxyribonuclease III [Zetaproteobacteria bacterium CG1_02_55_237]PIS19078.1 MAG: exodeoxyribonuclease III [Zetaproteobacteria bacterium CG08_land_8_20_14_0_20_55_17]PIW41949.1 MAG: exodeoxyribonuclease III [Zetaproteobacteria bacterium CG12_big_fil_rev_8_21_14_0_65_55_1124]PIY51407.1 MAG: exodeoxyribonuclease III [Zetaproteobacteria bacterium CG_4_10_14_0_8_um_filter_55_43]PIZ36998.1 MAG: exodeoxyribonuclease III [Zetaproteobacteria bacterium CG_4_10_14_0_2_um_filter_55_20]PJB81326